MKPHVYANIGLSLIFFSSLFSCQRAVDESSSKISIQLPEAMLASGLQVGGQAASNSVVSEVVDVEKNTDYLQMVPTGFSGGDYPINCYAVLAAGPEPAFKKNFCGKRDTKNIIQRDLEFGSYVAYAPAGAAIDFELPSGDGRQFYVLGLHAVSVASCRELASKPEKYNLTRPFLVGKSAPVSLKGGTETTVTVGLSAPGANDYFDDCVVTDDELRFPLAERIVIEQSSFPYGRLRKPVSVGYYCEPIEVALKNFSISLDGLTGSPATVAAESTARLQINTATPENFVDVLSYDTAADCYSNTNIKSGFSFLRNDTKKVRWIKISGSDASAFSRSYRSVFDNGSLASTGSPFLVTTDVGLSYFDIHMPRKVRPDKCYEIRTDYRNLNGQLTATAASADVTLATDPAGSATFFNSGSDCLAGTNQITTSIAVGAGQNTATYYMRTNTSGQEYRLSVSDSTTNIKSVLGQPKIRYPYAGSALIKNIHSISSLRFKGKNYIENSDTCQELIVYFVNDEGTSLHTGAAGGVLKLLAGASAMEDTTLYSNSNCTSVINGASPNITVAPSQYALSLYMKVSALATNFSPRHIQLSFSESSTSSITGRYDYYVTKAGVNP